MRMTVGSLLFGTDADIGEAEVGAVAGNRKAIRVNHTIGEAGIVVAGNDFPHVKYEAGIRRD